MRRGVRELLLRPSDASATNGASFYRKPPACAASVASVLMLLLTCSTPSRGSLGVITLVPSIPLANLVVATQRSPRLSLLDTMRLVSVSCTLSVILLLVLSRHFAQSCPVMMTNPDSLVTTVLEANVWTSSVQLVCDRANSISNILAAHNIRTTLCSDSLLLAT